jgi:hypothetical protein
MINQKKKPDIVIIGAAHVIGLEKFKRKKIFEPLILMNNY